MNETVKTVAIVLAAGSGTRMNSPIRKQYMQIDGKPILYYSLKTFEESSIDEIILVVAEGEVEYCRDEIVKRYGIDKVKTIVEGGKERYHSVYNGLKSMKSCDYVFIHDGARPFVTEQIINRALLEVRQSGACVVGMPVKDTIRIADKDHFAIQTPKRETVWNIQTPQVFSYKLICHAYEKYIEDGSAFSVTDDAMIVETMLEKKIKLIEGSYSNIKITTQEDLELANAFVKTYQL